MGIFAADKGLVTVLGQKFLDFGCRCVHLALHIARLIVAAVAENPFIMYKPGIVKLPESVCHIPDHGAAEGFISAGPDQDGRVVFVPLVSGIYPVQHHGLPFLPVAGHDPAHILVPASCVAVPGTVGLQIVFIDQIQAVAVAQPVDPGIVGIVAGTDGVDVVQLHGGDVLQDLILLGNSAGFGAELVAVDALKYDPFSVEAHDMIDHLKSAEAHIFGKNLRKLSVLIIDLQEQLIEIGLLRAPQVEAGYRK